MIELTNLEQLAVKGASNCTHAGNIGTAFVNVLAVAGGAATLCGSIVAIIPSNTYSTDLQRRQTIRAGVVAGIVMGIAETVCYAFSL